MTNPNATNETRVVDPNRNAYTWDGWGTCLSWWANTELGLRDDLAAAFFGRDKATVRIDGKDGVELPGLGLNIVRYNLGACGWEPRQTANGEQRMRESPNVVRRKQIEGYWPTGEDFDWWADENQRSMMSNARDQGANIFELFSVSPMWWMCYNLNPSGSDNGKDDNLELEQREGHAIYIAEVARHARDNWGIEFSSVEPFNEPTHVFPAKQQQQERCHYEIGAQQTILRYVRQQLDERGLDQVRVVAADEGDYNHARWTWEKMPDDVRDIIRRVNVHGYGYGNEPDERQALRKAVGDKPVWQSEWGYGDGHGLDMAHHIGLDLRHLRPSAWVHWQMVETSHWGALLGEFDDALNEKRTGSLAGKVVGVENRFYVMAQFTRHIRQGMRIIDSDHEATVAAYDAERKRLVLVTVNIDEAAHQVVYDLSKFSRVAGDGETHAIRVWATDAKRNNKIERQYQKERNLTLDGKSFTVSHEGHTIMTFEIDNVEI